MLTIIIPVYKLSKERKRNLEFLSARITEQLPDCRFIVSVQCSEEDGDYYSRFKEVIYFKNNFKIFNKSALINFSIANADIKSKFVMLLDGDLYFKFKNLSEQLQEFSSENIIKPFGECIYLTESLTEEFINNRKITLSGGLKQISALGGGAIILNYEFLKTNNIKYDENFFGWGWEDIDFGDNLRARFFIKTIKQTAIHLYHSVDSNHHNNYNYYKNKNRLKNIIVHTFSYACVDENNRLYSAQLSAIDSFFAAKKKLNVLLLNACSEFCFNNDNIKTVQLNKNAKEIGYTRDLPFLNDIVNSAIPYVEEEGWILYTNSDCIINESLYDDIIKYDCDYIEFKRKDVDSKGNYLRSITRGTDGFAIRKKILIKNPIPKLIVGAPYWDDVVSKIYNNLNIKHMVVNNQLTHTEHEVTYNINNLDIAGTFNFEKLKN